MIKPKIILTIGISNSGKSTWTREFIRNNPHFIDVNRDDTRIYAFCGMEKMDYHKYAYKNSREGLITSITTSRAEWALSNGQGVIVSDTNLNAKTRRTWEGIAAKTGVDIEYKVFDTPLHVCLGRNRKRDISHPPRVLRQQYASFRKYMGRKEYTPDTSKRKAVIFDIDGTLAHMNGRGPFDWSRVGEDALDLHVYEMLGMYHDKGYEIIMMSGRDGICRPETERWLEMNIVPYTDLRMRTAGDQRADVLVKEELFWEIADEYNVVMAVDDRDQVVDMWRGLGIKCIQVGYGDF